MKMKLLIAEDDAAQSETLVKLIKVRLHELSFALEIVVVVSLAEAILHAASANATILDAELKDAGPEDVLEAVRSKQFRSPIIFLTGNNQLDYHARCKLYGADYVFVKGQSIGICRAILECFTKDVLLNTA